MKIQLVVDSSVLVREPGALSAPGAPQARGKAHCLRGHGRAGTGQARVEKASVCVAFIGESWGANGRVFVENDWVRQELRLALDRKLKILPLLVRRSSLTPAKLPPDLAAIANMHAVWLRTETLGADMHGLVGETCAYSGSAGHPSNVAARSSLP
jgi:hypothetical protein